MGYGLSADSTASTQATAPPPTAQLDMHTYPSTVPPTTATAEDEQQSKCLLCLLSPREEVLLCRDLVVCPECAVNMTKFGAGGTIVHNESETNAPGRDAGRKALGSIPTRPNILVGGYVINLSRGLTTGAHPDAPLRPKRLGVSGNPSVGAPRVSRHPN